MVPGSTCFEHPVLCVKLLTPLGKLATSDGSMQRHMCGCGGRVYVSLDPHMQPSVCGTCLGQGSAMYLVLAEVVMQSQFS